MNMLKWKIGLKFLIHFKKYNHRRYTLFLLCKTKILLNEYQTAVCLTVLFHFCFLKNRHLDQGPKWPSK